MQWKINSPKKGVADFYFMQICCVSRHISQSEERFSVRVAFEIFIAPKSYKVGKQSIGLTEEIDPGFSNNEIEWTTSQQGSNILYGLLVKLDKVSPGDVL